MLRFIKYQNEVINIDKISRIDVENNNKVFIRTDKGNVQIKTSNHPHVTAINVFGIITASLKNDNEINNQILDLDNYIESY